MPPLKGGPACKSEATGAWREVPIRVERDEEDGWGAAAPPPTPPAAAEAAALPPPPPPEPRPGFGTSPLAARLPDDAPLTAVGDWSCPEAKPASTLSGRLPRLPAREEAGPTPRYRRLPRDGAFAATSSSSDILRRKHYGRRQETTQVNQNDVKKRRVRPHACPRGRGGGEQGRKRPCDESPPREQHHRARPPSYHTTTKIRNLYENVY